MPTTTKPTNKTNKILILKMDKNIDIHISPKKIYGWPTGTWGGVCISEGFPETEPTGDI
jgi:hypothetical protein